MWFLSKRNTVYLKAKEHVIWLAKVSKYIYIYLDKIIDTIHHSSSKTINYIIMSRMKHAGRVVCLPVGWTNFIKSQNSVQTDFSIDHINFSTAGCFFFNHTEIGKRLSRNSTLASNLLTVNQAPGFSIRKYNI